MKGVVHWVSATDSHRAEVRVYDRLFLETNPGAADNLADVLNPESRTVMKDCYIETALADALPETRFQFERLGYFVADRREHAAATPVFNRVVTLRDTWAKTQRGGN